MLVQPRACSLYLYAQPPDNFMLRKCCHQDANALAAAASDVRTMRLAGMCPWCLQFRNECAAQGYHNTVYQNRKSEDASLQLSYLLSIHFCSTYRSGRALSSR